MGGVVGDDGQYLGAAVSGWDGKDQHASQPNEMAQICEISGFSQKLDLFG